MRFKLFLLAAVAMVATGLPARAELVWEFRLATNQNDPSSGAYASDGGSPPGPSPQAIPLGTTIATGSSSANPWLVQPNTDIIVQLVLRQTDNVQPAFFTSTGPPTQRMIQYGSRLNYVPGVFQHVTPRENYYDTVANPPTDINTYGTGAGGFDTDPTFNGSDATSSAFVAGTFGGLFQASGIYPLINLRMHTGASGSGRLVLTDIDAGDTTGSQAFPHMDPGIYDRALSAPINTASGQQTNGFEIFFQINAVPEPSSMVLAGLGLAGLGYRLRRKKAAQAEVAA